MGTLMFPQSMMPADPASYTTKRSLGERPV